MQHISAFLGKHRETIAQHEAQPVDMPISEHMLDLRDMTKWEADANACGDYTSPMRKIPVQTGCDGNCNMCEASRTLGF